MKRKDLIEKLQIVDENCEVVVEVETDYDGNNIFVSDCFIASVDFEGGKIVINATDPCL